MKFSDKYIKKRICWLTFFFPFLLCSQTITILDKENNTPIPNVTIYNNTKAISISSTENGTANLSNFKADEEIHFTHLAYLSKQLTKTQLQQQNYILYLQPKSQQLQEVVLSASRNKEQKNRVAEKIAIISSKDIKTLAPQTSADLLAQTAGVRVQKSQGGGGSPVIRGFEANRVLLVVDGVRMNNAIYRSGHLQNAITINPSSLERTEVVFGPSSVLYGSDALGGVVHFFTKEPRMNNDKMFSGNFVSQYSSTNTETTNSINIEISRNRWGSFTGISYSDFGDTRMGDNRKHGFNDWGLVTEYSNNSGSFYNPNPVSNSKPNLQRNSGYNQFDLLQKFIYKINDSSRLITNVQYSTSSKIPRFDRLTEYRDGSLRFAEWYYGPQKRILVSPQIHFNPKRSWLSKGIITAAFQNIEESRIERSFNSLTRETQIEKVNVYSLNADFFTNLREKRNLSYGLEFTHNDVTSNAFSRDLLVEGNQITGFENQQTIPTRYPSDGSSYTTTAAYINYRQDISTRSTFNSGVRYTFTHLQARWNEQSLIDANLSETIINNSSITANLSYGYRPTDLWQLNAVLSSGFRSPNIDDIGKIREQQGELIVPNPNLKPEYAYNAEIGITKFIKSKKNIISLNAFYTLLNRYIGRDFYQITTDISTPDPNTIMYNDEEVTTLANTNLGNAYIIGGTFDLHTQILPNLIWKANLTYTKGKTHEDNLPLPSISPLFGSVALQYNKNKFNAELFFRFSAKKNAEDFAITGEDSLEETPIINPEATEAIDMYYGTPSWEILNLRTQYQFTENVQLQFALENIFDIHYREFASGISATGRNFKIRLDYTF